jgi:UDP-glucose:(heptosyl)LPS alpha-1,3-glucosyltransferase
MKIALIRQDVSVKAGGAERYAVSLARALVDFGHEVHVFANTYDPIENVQFHSVPISSRVSAIKNWSFAKNVQSALRDLEFDVINGLSQIYPQDVYRLGDGIHRHWLKIRGGSPIGRIWNKISLRHRMILHIENKIFTPGNYRRIITNSKLCKAHANLYYDVPFHLIDVVYSGIDLDNFKPSVRKEGMTLRTRLGVSKAKVIILFAGMNFGRKGLKPLLVAVSRLKNRDKYLVLIVGPGNASPYKRLVRSLGLAGKVMFCGFQPHMSPYYGAADIFVLPTYYDPCANVCLEAMACGLPVVTTRGNGASELILHEKSGIVVKHPEDTDDLGSWLEALEDPELRRSMGTLAHGQVESLSVRKSALSTLSVYEKVAQDKLNSHEN